MALDNEAPQRTRGGRLVFAVNKGEMWTYCPKCKTEWNGNDCECPKCGAEVNGVFCPELDQIDKDLSTWSDMNVDPPGRMESVGTLICRNCHQYVATFSIFSTDNGETLARCKCGMWYIVHSG